MWLAAERSRSACVLPPACPATRRAAAQPGAVVVIAQAIAAGHRCSDRHRQRGRMAPRRGGNRALVVGIVVGEPVADQVATRAWGKAQ